MIEFCTKKRMLIAVVILIGLSIITLVLESRWSYQHKLTEARLQAVVNSNETCNLAKYTVIESCRKCTRAELRKVQHYCNDTGYKTLIQCGKKKMYKGCDITPNSEQKQFWIFEGVCVVVGITSYFVVHRRRQMLDKMMMDKINKQIAAGI